MTLKKPIRKNKLIEFLQKNEAALERIDIVEWFWANFDWTKHSLWMGDLSPHLEFPEEDDKIVEFLERLVADLSPQKNNFYIKLYFSRANITRKPKIKYFIICNENKLPEKFTSSILNIISDKYQITREIYEKKELGSLIEHYLFWNADLEKDELIKIMR